MFLVSSCEPRLNEGCNRCFDGAAVVLGPWFECVIVNYILNVVICNV